MNRALRLAPLTAVVALLIAGYALFERSFLGFPDGYLTAYARLARVVTAILAAISVSAAAALLWASATKRTALAATVTALYVSALICVAGTLLAGSMMLDNGQGG